MSNEELLLESKRKILRTQLEDLCIIKNEPGLLDEYSSDLLRKLDLKREELKFQLESEIELYYNQLLDRIKADKELCLEKISQLITLNELACSEANNDCGKQIGLINTFLFDVKCAKENLNITQKYELIEQSPLDFKPSKYFGILKKRLNYVILNRDTKIFSGHESFVLSVKQGRNGEILSSSFDQSIKVWDLASLKCTQTLTGHCGSVTSIQVLDSHEIISGSRDKTIKIWDLRNGKCKNTLRGHEDDVWSVQCLKNGEIISGSSDKTVRRWDKESGECKLVYVGHLSSVNCVDVLGSGEIVSGSSDGSVKLWKLDGECKETLRTRTNGISCVHLLNGDRIVSGSWDGRIEVWNKVNVWQSEMRFEGHSKSVKSICSAESSEILSGSSDKTIKIWNGENGDLIKEFEFKSPVNSIYLLRTGEILAGFEDKSLKMIF